MKPVLPILVLSLSLACITRAQSYNPYRVRSGSHVRPAAAPSSPGNGSAPASGAISPAAAGPTASGAHGGAGSASSPGSAAAGAPGGGGAGAGSPSGSLSGFPDMRDSIGLKLYTAKQTLLEYHPGLTYLEVSNNSSDTLKLSIQSKGPDFITISSPNKEVRLPPKNSYVFEEYLTVGNRTYPGTALVLYQLNVHYKGKGQGWETSKIITQDVETGVLGESGIMTILGLNVFSIPFFLLLPGFLFLIVWSSFLPAGFKSGIFPLPTNKAEPSFWVTAISLSFVLSGLYCLVSRRALWIGYGLLDVFFLWLLSIVLSIVVLAILIAYERSKEFTARDTPLLLLEKLHKRGMDLCLEQGELAGAGDLLVFRLGINATEGLETLRTWYSYGIIVAKADNVEVRSRRDGLYMQTLQFLRDLDNKANRNINHPFIDYVYLITGKRASMSASKRLIGLLKNALEHKAITVRFQNDERPICLEKETFRVVDKYKRIVQG